MRLPTLIEGYDIDNKPPRAVCFVLGNVRVYGMAYNYGSISPRTIFLGFEGRLLCFGMYPTLLMWCI